MTPTRDEREHSRLPSREQWLEQKRGRQNGAEDGEIRYHELHDVEGRPVGLEGGDAEAEAAAQGGFPGLPSLRGKRQRDVPSPAVERYRPPHTLGRRAPSAAARLAGLNGCYLPGQVHSKHHNAPRWLGFRFPKLSIWTHARV